MNTKALRQKILDLAIHGKLVPQDPNDEPASVLLERIKAEKERLIKEGKIKRTKRSKAACDKPHYENEAPFEVPSSWAWCKLGEVCVFLSRGRSPKYLDEDRQYPVFAQKCNLKEGGISLAQARFLDPMTINKWDEVYKLRTGDVLVNSTGTGTVGRTRLFNESCLGDYPFVVPDSHVSVVRTATEIVSEYIYAYMSSNVVQEYLEDNLAGSTNQKELYISILDNLQIPLPPYVEQKRIVSEIEKWNKACEAIENGKSDLEKVIRQTKIKILDLAIHGKLVLQDSTDEPASELLKRINPKAVIACDNPHYRNLPFQIPSTWAWCSHNDVLEISGGSQPAKRFFSSVPQKGYVRLYQIRDYGENPIPVYIPNDYAMKQTEEGDILLARYGGSLGKVFHAKKGAYNVAMAKVIFKDKDLINKEYAYFYYLSDLYQGRLKEISRTAQAGFNSSDFNEMYFPLPPYEEQQRIVNAINKAFTTLDAIAENL